MFQKYLSSAMYHMQQFGIFSYVDKKPIQRIQKYGLATTFYTTLWPQKKSSFYADLLQIIRGQGCG